jgi:hypothetical protein
MQLQRSWPLIVYMRLLVFNISVDMKLWDEQFLYRTVGYLAAFPFDAAQGSEGLGSFERIAVGGCYKTLRPAASNPWVMLFPFRSYKKGSLIDFFLHFCSLHDEIVMPQTIKI